MTCCEATSNGGTGVAASAFDNLEIDEDTTSDEPVVVRVAELPVLGAMVWMRARVFGVDGDATAHAWRFSEGSAARNAGGVGARFDLDGLFGYDAASPPWANTTLPALTLQFAMSGNLLVLNIVGPTGVPFTWRGVVERIFVQGATP